MKTHFWALASFCFAATLGVFLLVQSTLRAPDSPYNQIPVALDWIVASGVFALFFHLLTAIYQSTVYKVINRERFISGSWYQVFIVNGDEPLEKRIRHGACNITTTLEDTIFSATNLRMDGSFSSNWNSQSVVIDGRQLSLMFVSEGNRNGSRGTMNFNIQGSPPNLLVGQFNDSSPATHHGDIRIFKEKSAYEHWLLQLQSTQDAE